MRTLIVHDSLHVTVVERVAGAVRSLREVGEPVAITMDQAERQFYQAEAELVIVCISPEHPDHGLDVIRRLREAIAGHLLAVGQANDPKLILRAMQMGADLFIDEAELVTELQAALARLRVKQGHAAPPGRLLGVLPTSGGSGASTLAVNIAAVLAAERGRCTLIDLNSSHGDLAALLDLKPQHTLADVCRYETRLDQAMFEKVLARHACGIHLLAAPQDFEEVRILTQQGVAQALILSRKLFTDVVVDLEDCFHEEQVCTLQKATGIFVICRLDFTSLRNLRRVLDHLGKIGIPRRLIRAVINQYGRPGELPLDEAEEALGEKLNCFVPYDPKTINAANNTGIPVVVKDPHCKLVRCLAQLAKTDFDCGEPGTKAGKVESLVLQPSVEGA
jgi:pilus assembly protein CpaE